MNFKKISALACTMTILGGMATATPVFAADQKTSNVPVTGKVGLWQNGNTDPSNPDGSGSGGQGEGGEVDKPQGVTDINVTVPASMTFDVATNTKDGEPAFASGTYTVTNNGATQVSMSGQYQVTGGDIQLVDIDSVKAAKDGQVQLGVSLDANDAPFIANVKNQAESTPVTLQAKSDGGNTATLKFASTTQGMADVKKEASAGGALDNTTKSTQGNLVLTFQAAGV